ncbi:MAG: type II secretion system protein [Planctomycetota bacterium]|jgi:prepilin-type N-terminal cleavage/methylation domain-containing protein/prepilin-type processing-associated H-X9-DG protein
MSFRRKGFTLIELLVVIAIIALLMSILMPALRNVRDQAKDSMCMQRLQQWGVMFNMYADDWNGILMGWSDYSWWSHPSDPTDHFVEHAWVYLMYSYAKDFEIYLCPGATDLWATIDDFQNPRAAWDFEYIIAIAGDPEMLWYYLQGDKNYPIYSKGSYGKNEWITEPAEWCKDDDFYVWNNFYLNIRVRNPSLIPLHGDSNFAAGFPHSYDEAAITRLHGPVDGGGGETNRWNLDRHNLSVNFAFLDWSVRKVGLRQLWRIKWNRESTLGGASNWGNLRIVPDWNDPLQWPEWMQNAKNYDL